jgi:XRE family transcriptional regulator of biofilm formation
MGTGDIDLKRLGENIRYLRQGRDWSLSVLAERSGVSKAYISDLENGAGGRPNIQYLYKIATALDTTIDGLVNQSFRTRRAKASRTESSSEPLPPGLEEFAGKEGLEPEQIDMLARLNFRGNRPKDADAWKLIYEAIKIASRS